LGLCLRTCKIIYIREQKETSRAHCSAQFCLWAFLGLPPSDRATLPTAGFPTRPLVVVVVVGGGVLPIGAVQLTSSWGFQPLCSLSLSPRCRSRWGLLHWHPVALVVVHYTGTVPRRWT